MKRGRAQDEPSIRRPPGFTEYGSDLLGLEAVKLMSLAERGLFATLRWHLWANDTIPADPKLMARLLGVDAAEVEAALTDRVRAFFAPAKDDANRLVCPDLAKQMARLMMRRDKQLQGTLNSHKSRREQRKEQISTHVGSHGGSHDGSGVASELKRTEPKRTALSKEIDERRDADIPF